MKLNKLNKPNKPDKLKKPDRPNGSGPDPCWLGLSFGYARYMPISSVKGPEKSRVPRGPGFTSGANHFTNKERGNGLEFYEKFYRIGREISPTNSANAE